ncbi:nucleoporin Nup37-like [Corticium candelabrum]|uniref:nucleoporin Nup37-like n=1 Tax=Corticium candelabrum TaxID=121492 RepID=UPI002E2F49C9|nr:nucleoporin Nup37-like [Corticium candelabrum]
MVCMFSQPIQSGLAHQTMGSQFRWCRQGELLFSTTSTLDKEFKLHHRGHQKVPISMSLTQCGLSSWQCTTPVCEIADGRQIRLFSSEL